MPKNKRKTGGGGSKSRALLTASNLHSSGDDNSDLNVDSASTISNASTNMSYQDIDSVDDPTGRVRAGETEMIEKIDNMESQLNSVFDGLMEKGFKEREDALKVMKKLFSHKYLLESLQEKRFTISESLLRCIKKGKSNEQVLACQCLQLTMIQFATVQSDAMSLLADSRPLLVELIDDDKLEPEVRAECIRTLGLALFITNENSNDTISVLDKLDALFAQSYAKGDGSLRLLTPKTYELHAAALSTWCLLLCVMPLPYVNKLAQKHVKSFQDFLKSPDVDLRIVAGETIAFLYELALCDSHSDLSMFEADSLIDLLTALANDSSKHRSKKDKKQQRVIFRDILKTIADGNAFDGQTIKFGSESLFLDNWVRRKQYDTLRELLGTGMNTHLLENEYVRDLFDLGAPIPISADRNRANASSMTRIEKTQFNKEQFRNRTKNMNKKRENKEGVRADMEED